MSEKREHQLHQPGKKTPKKAKLKGKMRLYAGSALLMLAGLTGQTQKSAVQAKGKEGKASKSFGKKVSERLHSTAKKVKSGGNFRLLNIYNNLTKSNPKLAHELNNRTVGEASWYGGFFHGRKTAMGTTYNKNELTAAHRTLKLGTWVRVTNLANNESVIVQVTDRGPYVANRILDLSERAATDIGYKDKGVGHVKMEVLGSQKPIETDAGTLYAEEVVGSSPLFAGIEGAAEILGTVPMSDPDYEDILRAIRYNPLVPIPLGEAA
jgi:rare lipoprotein A